MKEDSLKQKTVKGISWNGLTAVLGQVTGVIVNIILANLLDPSHFGLIAIVTMFSGFAELFGDLGFSPALVQRKENSDSDLSTVFWLNNATGLVLAFIFIAIAPFISQFYGEPKLIYLLIAISPAFLLSACSMVHESQLNKQLDFRSVALSKLVGTVISSIVSIFMAMTGFGVWALISKLLISRIVTTIYLFWSFRWMPKFTFDFKFVKKIGAFGLNLTGIKVLIYWSRKIDDLLIGKFMGSSALGIYNNAYKLLIMPIRTIKSQVLNVAFPTFSKIQDDLPRIKRMTLKLTFAIAIVSVPLMALMYLIADEFVLLLLNEKWVGMIPLVKIFSIASVFELIVFTESLLAAFNKTNILFRLVLATRLFFVINIFIGLQWGLIGVAYGVGISMVINFFPLAYYSGKPINLKPLEILQQIAPILLINAALAAGLTYLAAHYWSSGLFVTLLAKCVVFVGIYLGFILFFYKKELSEAKTLFSKKNTK